MSGLEVLTGNLSEHPACPHGPTLLFSRTIHDNTKKFFACSACRDRKDCSFFLSHDELGKVNSIREKAWAMEREKYIKGVNPQRRFVNLNKVLGASAERRFYCKDCTCLMLSVKGHEEHDVIRGISDYNLEHPSEFLPPLDDSKKEAQFLFTKKSVEVIVGLLKEQNIKNVLCIGTPRIYEYIKEIKSEMNALLLDFDRRYHDFFGPLEFIWYNAFNNHFFLKDTSVFDEFIDRDNLVIVTDPPFGGRIEPLAQTFKTIANKNKGEVPIFWIFPYFMEPQIMNSLPDFHMLDYKVDYENHPLFTKGPKGRKHGSPVRIFTNLNPRLIKLPEDEGYRYCQTCQRYVSQENKHCEKCKSCTSKDGRTYTHCDICQKCVKPSWKHCETCEKCALVDHKCGLVLNFNQECFHCKERGHKKRECPNVDREGLKRARKNGTKFKNKTKKNIKKQKIK